MAQLRLDTCSVLYMFYVYGIHACTVQCTMYMQEMDDADDRITSELYIEGGSNYTAISSLAWRY